MTEIRDDMPSVGQRVALLGDIDRFPQAVIPKGATGTVEYVTEDQIAVKLDETVPSFGEWDNCLMFYAEQECMEGETLAQAFWSQVDEAAPAPAP